MMELTAHGVIVGIGDWYVGNLLGQLILVICYENVEVLVPVHLLG